MRKLHDEEGMTYEKIGELYGISKQAVHQIVTNTPKDHFHLEAVQKIPYIGLRDWMIENRVKLGKLDELTGKPCMRSITGGHEPRKSTIDAILRATGLTYEECFREETN